MHTDQLVFDGPLVHLGVFFASRQGTNAALGREEDSPAKAQPTNLRTLRDQGASGQVNNGCNGVVYTWKPAERSTDR